MKRVFWILPFFMGWGAFSLGAERPHDSLPQTRHWAFLPLRRPALPVTRCPDRLRTSVDSFIEAALEKKGLSLGAEADRLTLLRRVSFDLTGLPPTPADIEAFRADRSADAYECMIERYLASPHYGERWGKYWLDAAGYADSNGYFSADSNRPLAYRYRDYVIEAFNRDKPYDRFVREQLAGDELAGYAPGSDVAPSMVALLTATHFLRNAPDGSGESDGNPDEVRTDRFTVLEGNLQITMNCLLGLTIQCARCHSHKFEPISQEEYYCLQTIFYPVYCPERWIKPNDRVVTLASRAEQEEHQRRNARIDRQIQALRACSAAADGPVRKHIQQAIAAREKERPRPLEKLAVVTETDANPPAHHILRRGQHNAPGREVQPGVPAALCTTANVYRLQPHPAGRVATGRRSAFAQWVTSPDNPLFARVLVNRLWQHHFGRGIVATPDNLGQSGAKPTHPQLLDYLASELIRSGWSIKALHRLILRSAVYRQSSAIRDDSLRIEPDNRLLWHFPLRRLDAEALRDAMLAVSGELDGRRGGPYIPTHRRKDGTVVADEKRDDARRRSVYLQQRRSQALTLLELFDAPLPNPSCSFRNTSTIPLQSLALLNDDFVRARARGLARRLEREAGAEAEKRIALGCTLVFGRAPRREEQTAARRFLSTQKQLLAQEKSNPAQLWIDFCQMLLASNAFLYVE